MLMLLVLSTLLTFNGEAEAERIRSHLELVERLLRAQPSMSPERIRNLDALNAYWRRGEFPRNITVPGGRNPIFIDDRGVPCAAGALIIASGSRALALRVADTQNEKFLDEMHDDELNAWVAHSGLSLDELRLIQPSYSYRPTYDDPLLEAAYLGDLAKVKALKTKSTVTAALHAAVASARVGRTKKTERRGVYYETRWVSDGFDVIEYLIDQGADVNDSSVTQQSPLGSAQLERFPSPELIALLKKRGAVLSPTEKVLFAVKQNDCKSLPALLRDPKVDFTGRTHPMGRENEIGTDCSLALIRSGKLTWGNYFGSSWFMLLQDKPVLVAELLAQGVKLTTQADVVGTLEAWRRAHRSADQELTANLRKALDTNGVRLTEPKSETDPNLHCPAPVMAALDDADLEAIDYFVKLGGTLKGCQTLRLAHQLDGRAARLTEKELARITLALRAGLDTYDTWRDVTPLTWAADIGDLPFAKALLEHKAIVDAGAGYLCTPLALAATRDNFPMVDLLLAHGAQLTKTFMPDKRCGWPNSLGKYHRDFATVQDVSLSPKMRKYLKLGPPTSAPESHVLE
jgi:ankyrin repeat protein